MDTERISYLLKQYLDDSITPAELEELMTLVLNDAAAGDIQAAVTALIDRNTDAADAAAAAYDEAAWEPLLQHLPVGKVEAKLEGGRVMLREPS